MEDVLYFLLVIGWVIYSFYKKSEKAKQELLRKQQQMQEQQMEHQQEVHPVPQQPSSSLKTGNALLDALLSGVDMEEEYKKTEPVYEYRPPVQEAQPDIVYAGIDKVPPKPTMGDNSSRQITKRFTFEESTDAPAIFDPATFDLRRAMIYSTIMNRPVY